MRKMLVIVMGISFILTIITGIGESSPSHAGPPVAHIIIVILFIASVLTHSWVNRKALARCFSSSKKQAGTSRP